MPTPRPDSNARPAALALCPEAPYPTIGGGAVRTASLLEYLAGRYELDVVVFREPGTPDPAAAFPPCFAREVRVIELPYHGKRRLARVGRNLRRYVRGAPPLNDRFGGFSGALDGMLRGRRYDVALIEHFWCAPYHSQVAPLARTTVLDLHNVESLLHERCAGSDRWPASLLLRRFARASERLESHWLPRYSLVLATSAEDASRVRAISAGTRVCVYPNALPLLPPCPVPEDHAIVFSGNLEYHPNVAAVRYFRQHIWPALRERWPGLRWRIVGRNPHGIAPYTRGDDRIDVWGPVPDAVAALASARVVVVPLLSGSGTRVKILEAWAAARPVVSTAIGAEGLGARDGEELLLADDPQSFTDAVSRLLESEPLRARLGAAGRNLYERCFTWPAAWKALEAAGI